MKPPQQVPRHIRERLEIAAFTNEVIQLYWTDETSDTAYFGLISPLGVTDVSDTPGYLVGLDEEGAEIHIRLDLICNLPTPIK